MKVIWEAKGQIRRNCPNCGSLLEIEERDIRKSEFFHDPICTCLVCETDFPIGSDGVLFLIRN